MLLNKFAVVIPAFLRKIPVTDIILNKSSTITAYRRFLVWYDSGVISGITDDVGKITVIIRSDCLKIWCFKTEEITLYSTFLLFPNFTVLLFAFTRTLKHTKNPDVRYIKIITWISKKTTAIFSPKIDYLTYFFAGTSYIHHLLKKKDFNFFQLKFAEKRYGANKWRQLEQIFKKKENFLEKVANRVCFQSYYDGTVLGHSRLSLAYDIILASCKLLVKQLNKIAIV